MREYVDYLFRDSETCEEFFVELEKGSTVDDAWHQLEDVYGEDLENVKFIMAVDPEIAEAYGYDTY